MVSKILFYLLLISLASFETVNSLKILGLFPYPGVSHFRFFHPILRGLAEAGHDITVVGHFPDKNPPSNYKDLKLPEIKVLTNSINLGRYEHRPWYQLIMESIRMNQYGINICEIALNSTAIKIILKSQPTYDVILMEQYRIDCMMGVAWKLNAPIIGLSSCVLMPWHYDRLGSPFIPSFMPGIFFGYTDQMSYLQRINNWVSCNVFKQLYNFVTLETTDKLVRKYMKDDNMPHLSELVKETSLMFVNSHYSFTGSRPNAPTIVELGGIHAIEAKPLEPELKSILDSSKDGVIYVSWGSLIRADTLPVDKRDSLLKVFSSLKQTVLWKWENETLPNQPKNVLIRKWMPQRDILCHPNVRVFVSHGGLMGSIESVHCGVPMVLIPMAGDQFYNAAAAEARGMGSIVHYEDLTEETMKAAIDSALTQQSRHNAKQVSYSFRNRPKPPMETAVWWVEYVAATRGAPFLKSYSTHLSTFVYYSVDVLATISVALISIIALLICLVRKCIGKPRTHQNHVKSKEE